jgi:hypothetical protein
MAVPNAPTNLVISAVTSNSLVITWASGGGETSFNIYGSPGATGAPSGVFVLIANLPAGTLTLQLNNLSPSTGYAFQVTGLNSSGESLPSNSTSVVTGALTPVTTTPTLGLQFTDLVLRVAEYLGVADYSGGVAAIPTDAHDLDLCKRIVNDGYARFLYEKEWFFLSVTMQLTPDGINYIFDLPYDFQGELLQPWTYPVTGPISAMRETSEMDIRARRAGTNTTGYPTLFAHQAKDTVDATTNTARWQVIFWPTPYDNTLLLTAKYRRFPMALVNLTDRSVAGPIHDQSVLQAAKAAAEIQRYGEAGPQEELYMKLLENSKRKDDNSVDKNVGGYGDRSDDGKQPGHRPRDQYRVDTYDGVSVLDVSL